MALKTVGRDCEAGKYRTASVTGCPYLIFIIQYGNHVHQIALPLPRKDGMGKDPVQTTQVFFPHPRESADHGGACGLARSLEEYLSSPEFRRGEPSPCAFPLRSR